jgi:outer membrane autotransporter protein
LQRHKELQERAGRHRFGVGSRATLPFFCALCLVPGGLGTAFAQTPPFVPPGDGNIFLSTPSATLDLGTRFLRHLGTEAAARATGMPGQFDPSGGGADLDSMPQAAAQAGDRYRVWFEGYGMRTRMDPRGDFAGDRRRIFGGVAGIGMRLAPGVSAGLSVDQSRTDVDVTPLAQSSRIDLTQVGGNLAFESGPWLLGIAAIHGFGNVDSLRGTGAPSVTSYDTKLWGALTELSYLWSLGNWRVVPKIGMDWTRTHSDAFIESGGVQPLVGSTQDAERSRVFAGAELGHTWLAGRTVMDFSVYGRGVNIMSLHAGGLTVVPVSGGALPRYIAGVSEDRLGFDTGAALSVRLSPRARLYAVYDGRFRGNFDSHAGTIGLDVRW